ncbi:hypothetical protein F4823DRAFT_560228 [Ustulina deusta]|nr:hypothetical protein F4823DRAFT_560228 [Ustulina deusta]
MNRALSQWPQPLNNTYEARTDALSYSRSHLGSASRHYRRLQSCRRWYGWLYGGRSLRRVESSARPAIQYSRFSDIVRTSQDRDQSLIAVSLSYRPGMFGFPQTPQVLAEGSSDAGLLDRRLAVAWIKVLEHGRVQGRHRQRHGLGGSQRARGR